MDTVTQQEHPGVIALRERITQFRIGVEYWRKQTEPSDEDARLTGEIEKLVERRDMLRRHRLKATDELVKRCNEISHLEHTLDLCRADSRLAQAVWLKLLVDVQGQRKSPS